MDAPGNDSHDRAGPERGAVRLGTMLAATALLAACNAGAPAEATPATAAGTMAPAVSATLSTVPGGPPAAEVLRAYVERLSEGDVEGAAAWIAVPARFEVNIPGLPREVEIASTADAEAFVARLPDCEHRIVSVTGDGEYAAAEAELSGADCPRPDGTVVRIPARVVAGRIQCFCEPGQGTP